MSKATCQVTACTNLQVALGLCWKHYTRKRRHGHMQPRRHYRTKPHCRSCGTEKSEDFYPRYKGICKLCRKVSRVYRANAQEDSTDRLISFAPAASTQ